MTVRAASDPDELERILCSAAAAARPARRSAATDRARWLDEIAAELGRHGAALIEAAAAETHLDRERLAGELVRTRFQLGFFAELVRGGAVPPVALDRADPSWPPAPRPDLRQTMVPLGVALVFGASNFPFAFGVLGGDSASALAAGCPVIVKPHPAHPRTARLLAGCARTALARAGAPAGLFSLIEGDEAAVAALRDRRVRVGSFTGSTAGGRALFDVAVSRPEPIPFFAEMGSTNPVVVSPGAWRERGEGIAQGFAASLLGSGGQLCTAPGIVFVPDAASFLAAVDLPPAPRLLHEGIVRGFDEAVADFAAVPDVQVHRFGGTEPHGVRTTLIVLPLLALHDRPELMSRELFGPGAVVVEYASLSQIADLVVSLGGQLTATLHADPDEEGILELADDLAQHVGRLVWNQWPTGVAVSRAQTHGGPYPATTVPGSTSVGSAAVLRFLRPLTYQNAPEEALPPELRDGAG